jgi:peptide chain release factor 2
MTWPTVFDVATKKTRVAEITGLQSKPDFWSNREQATDLTQELSELTRDLSFIEHTTHRLSEQQELAEMAASEGDVQTSHDIAQELEQIEKEIAAREKLLKFSGPYDSGNAIITIQSGAGGTDAQDWAAMLERMYIRYAERVGWNTSLIDRMPGEEAGVKHTTFTMQGPYAYGILKSEHGVHRLVRLSPFNADAKRQTSFARVEIMPQLKEAQLPDIDPKDLEIDTYRSSGAGGQHVNKTSSAVRVRHIPTGLVAASQNQRSQAQNKEAAMSMLASKIQLLLEQQHVQHVQDLRGEFQEAAFGSQIRSYVLHPYTLVKDHRTNIENRNAQDVLDGNLDTFVVQ